ncbi:MAG TPA: hypothetical protein GX400_19100 [Chloroflexi bacterium]|nr:hypothetical protein [Chloroflexota bacterium]
MFSRIQCTFSKTLLLFLCVLVAGATTACAMNEVNRPTVLSQAQTTATPTPTIVCDPSESRIVCEDRLASQKITPPPPPELSAEFLTAEAEYQQNLLEWTPMPEPPITTPTPSYLLTPHPQEGLLIFRGRSAYQEHPRFEVTFDSNLWRLEEYEEGPVLIHRTIEGCRVVLMAIGRGMIEMPTILQKELAGYSVEVREFHQNGLISYGFSVERAYYAFVLLFPSDTDDSAVRECQVSGEAILDTFRLAPE